MHDCAMQAFIFFAVDRLPIIGQRQAEYMSAG
jgi:hypothetical protein